MLLLVGFCFNFIYESKVLRILFSCVTSSPNKKAFVFSCSFLRASKNSGCDILGLDGFDFCGIVHVKEGLIVLTNYWTETKSSTIVSKVIGIGYWLSNVIKDQVVKLGDEFFMSWLHKKSNLVTTNTKVNSRKHGRKEETEKERKKAKFHSTILPPVYIK